MNHIMLSKTEILKIIKRYFEKVYFGQAIKVKAIARKQISTNEENASNKQNISNYKITVENIFLVSGYLEKDGMLHKFSKILNNDELTVIIKDNYNNDIEIEKIKFHNKFTHSYLENDRLKADLSSVEIKAHNNKNKVLVKE